MAPRARLGGRGGFHRACKVVSCLPSDNEETGSESAADPIANDVEPPQGPLELPAAKGRSPPWPPAQGEAVGGASRSACHDREKAPHPLEALSAWPAATWGAVFRRWSPRHNLAGSRRCQEAGTAGVCAVQRAMRLPVH